MSTRLGVEEIIALFKKEFPQLHEHEYGAYSLEDVAKLTARMRLHATERHLRPGGTVSGPALMTLADLAMYCAILAQIGPEALTVTTNFNINFMRKPEFGDIVADAKIMKLGKALVVTECILVSDVSQEIVAHATGTYSIPPRK